MDPLASSTFDYCRELKQLYRDNPFYVIKAQQVPLDKLRRIWKCTVYISPVPFHSNLRFTRPKRFIARSRTPKQAEARAVREALVFLSGLGILDHEGPLSDDCVDNF
jgi:hypothetical protein